MSGVFRDPVVAEVDGADGVRSVRGMAPGPAGAATMEVAEGVSVSVDFADPSVLCAIEVEPSAGADVLPVLLGATRASQVTTAAVGAPVVRVEGRSRGSASLTSLPTEQPAHELAVVTSLVSLAEDPLRVPLARVANAAEVLAAIANGVRGLVDGRAVARRMDRVLDDACAVAHGDAMWLAARERGLARRLADLLERVGVDVKDPELVGILRRAGGSARAPRGGSSRPAAGEAVEPGAGVHGAAGSDGGAPVAGAAGAEVPSAVPSAAVSSAVVDLPPGMAAPVVEQQPGRVSATMADGRGAWLRVADSSTMVLHAVVPFVEAGTSWRADAVVAPDLAPEHVVVAITFDPVPTASTTLSRMRRAIALGRRAVEQAQAGRVDRAGNYWRECEEAWRALGDESRAARAADYATRRARPGRPRSLGERINISIGREVPKSGT